MAFFVLEIVKKKNVIISEGSRPFWQLIIAAFFYTVAIYFLYLFFSTIDLYAKSKAVKSSFSALEAGILAFMAGMGFSSTKDYYFDFKNNRFKPVFRVGPIKIGKWQALKKLEYISIFKNPKEEFEVNLWYDRNRHFNISLFDVKNDAISEGKQIAKELSIKLLDATIANNHKWLSLE